jgi:hypothetical protein
MAPKSTTPSKFQTYLSRRWAEGCTTGRDLLPEIKCLGYTGSLSQLERLLTQWRHVGHAMAADAPAAATGILSDPTTGQLVSPIVAAALCIKRVLLNLRANRWVTLGSNHCKCSLN